MHQTGHREVTQTPEAGGGPQMAQVIGRNIEALLDQRRQEEQHARLEDRVADAVTRFTGSMRFVILHLVVFGLWIAVNLGWVPGIRKFDPSFVILAMVASVEAIFLSTFVLISQNRMMALSDRRADLDLHVSLLAEHEVTRLIELVTAMAERMGIEQAQSPELRELARNIHPVEVMEEIAASEKRRREEG